MEGVNIFVCNETKQLKKAKVVIENEMLVITCDEVEMPVYVRYGFDYNYSGCHIYNKAGLPLAPFHCQNRHNSMI